ncbi:hypothetical protein FACS1894106_2750 [Spirochaetia bacterium]|nr:hypothetical protein FACS1894106_2750 [Spirochaetia bacterium]
MYRRIDSDLWTDAYFQELQPVKKTLILYFLTSEHTTINGRYIADLDTMVSDIGFSKPIIQSALGDLIKDSKVSLETGDFNVSKDLMKFVWWQHGPKGERSGHWKGGITPINAKIRTSREYRQWRKEVIRRDEHTCQICGEKGLRMEAHHLKPFAKYPELRFVVSNGVTLCEDCHKDQHKGVNNVKN